MAQKDNRVLPNLHLALELPETQMRAECFAIRRN